MEGITEENASPPAEEPVVAPAAEPGENSGSGHFAVFSKDFGRFVSGVMSKSDAGKARTELGKTGETKGHSLKVLEV